MSTCTPLHIYIIVVMLILSLISSIVILLGSSDIEIPQSVQDTFEHFTSYNLIWIVVSLIITSITLLFFVCYSTSITTKQNAIIASILGIITLICTSSLFGWSFANKGIIEEQRNQYIDPIVPILK